MELVTFQTTIGPYYKRNIDYKKGCIDCLYKTLLLSSQGKGLPSVVLDVTTSKESKPDEVPAQEPLYSSVNRTEQQTEKVVPQEAIAGREFAEINQVR